MQVEELASDMRPAGGLDDAPAVIQTVEARVAIGVQHAAEPGQAAPWRLGAAVRAGAVEPGRRGVKLLRKLAFRRLSVRPQHPQSEPESPVLFKQSFPIS